VLFQEQSKRDEYKAFRKWCCDELGPNWDGLLVLIFSPQRGLSLWPLLRRIKQRVTRPF
jgi:hypothetical protein